MSISVYLYQLCSDVPVVSRALEEATTYRIVLMQGVEFPPRLFNECRQVGQTRREFHLSPILAPPGTPVARFPVGVGDLRSTRHVQGKPRPEEESEPAEPLAARSGTDNT